jgi:pimeloyl-ACP methyl ester carboxylesterase
MLLAFLQNVGLSKPGQKPEEIPQWQQWLPFKQSLRNSPAVVNYADNLSRLSNLESPVLLVKGTGSAQFLHKIIDELADGLPDSKVIEMPGGHAPHIVSREKFLVAWNDFQKDH